MDIKQISLHLKDGEAIFHQALLSNPLEDEPLRRQKPSLTWLFAGIESVLCHLAPKLSLESKFKTQLARILSQDLIKEHYLNHPQRREAFLDAIEKAAHHVGYTSFSKPSSALTSKEIANILTDVSGRSLLEQPSRLAFCAKKMKSEESPFLHAILSHLERAPLCSSLEIQNAETKDSISLSTHYSQIKVKTMDDGKVNFELFKNKTVPMTNQRIVLDTTMPDDPHWVGSYCGNLGSTTKLLEQILLIVQAKGEVRLSEENTALSVRILFTSLYNWKEMEEICRQRDAIDSLNGKTLHIGQEKFKLELFYYNLNSIYRLPIPPETCAFLEDLNDECIMRLLNLDSFDHLPEDFFARKKVVLEKIDRFRQNPPGMEDPVFQALVHKKRADGRSLKGMDALIYLEEAAKRLHIFHNKNCFNGVDRTSTAKAADKAQNALMKIATVYLPGYNDNKKLFKVLYRLYLLDEEPPMNAALSLGLFENHFLKRLFYLNPQQAEYVRIPLS